MNRASSSRSRSDDSKYGIVEIVIDNDYSQLMRAITNSDFDIIGFYYISPMSSNRNRNLILYDTYTGQSIIGEHLTIDNLDMDPSVRKITLRPLSFDISGNNIRDFHNSLGRLMTSQLSTFDKEAVNKLNMEKLKCLILDSVHLYKNPIYGGIHIVNQVLMALSGIDSSRHKQQISSHLVKSTMLSTHITKELTHQHGNKTVNIFGELKNNLNLVAELIKSLFKSNKPFQDRILASIGGMKMPTADETSDSSSSSSSDEDSFIVSIASPNDSGEDDIKSNMAELLMMETAFFDALSSGDSARIAVSLDNLNTIREKENATPIILPNAINLSSSKPAETNRAMVSETINIRRFMEKIINELVNDVPPVIYMTELAVHINDLLKSMDQDALLIHSLTEGSYGAILHIGNADLREERISIPLKTGNMIILPSRGADLSLVDEETLRQILWYLNSIVETDNRFISLQMIVTRELGNRRISSSK